MSLHFYYHPIYEAQAVFYSELLTPLLANSHSADDISLFASQEPFKNKWLKRLPPSVLVLLYDEKGLWLAVNDGKQPLKIQANWLAQQKRVVTAGKKSELLLKAAKIQQGMRVIDATAGLGHDSIIMAGRGAEVTMLEQQPLMFGLLTDAMTIIAKQPHWQSLHARLSLHGVNAIGYFKQLATDIENNKATKVDLVYLDPMFPADSYKSAQVTKNMQLLHQLASPPSFEQEQQLLANALTIANKVIVKRPKDAPFLAEKTPLHQWSGDVIRFDGYQQ